MLRPSCLRYSLKPSSLYKTVFAWLFSASKSRLSICVDWVTIFGEFRAVGFKELVKMLLFFLPDGVSLAFPLLLRYSKSGDSITDLSRTGLSCATSSPILSVTSALRIFFVSGLLSLCEIFCSPISASLTPSSSSEELEEVIRLA